MARYGMVIDLERCIGCRACMDACKVENNTPTANFWMYVFRLEEGAYPNTRVSFLPRPCQHCDNAPCVKVCPVGATYHGDGGLVLQDSERCIGCRYCMVACPYGVRTFNWGAPDRPTDFDTGMVPPRPVGTVEKCTMCVHRLADGQVPSCVWSCPAQARIFGDLADPESRVTQLVRDREGERLLEERGTEPKVWYLPPRRRRGL